MNCKLSSFSSVVLYGGSSPQPLFYTSFSTGANTVYCFQFFDLCSFVYALRKACNAIFFPVFQLKLDLFLKIFLKNLLLLKSFPDLFKMYVITCTSFFEFPKLWIFTFLKAWILCHIILCCLFYPIY